MLKYRKNNRLKEYDYSKRGFYFVTICTKNREELLGSIENEQMVLNEYGKIVKMCWFELPNHYRNCILDDFTIMPNHIHGIIIIDNSIVGTGFKPVPTDNYKKHGLSEIVRGFKTFSSKNINHLLENTKFQWQRSFYDHIIRNEKELLNVRNYIIENPLKWDLDMDNIKNVN